MSLSVELDESKETDRADFRVLLVCAVVKMKSDEDKTKVLSPHLLMAYSGEPGECTGYLDRARLTREMVLLGELGHLHARSSPGL